MDAEILYFPFSDDEEKMALRAKVQHDDYTPTADEIAEHWESQGTTEVDASDHQEALNRLWAQWNAGSGMESEDFARRECHDCDATFTGALPHGGVDLEARQQAAEEHERKTRARGDPHTVGHGHRSMSSGDIVVIDGQHYLCAPIGWKELEDGGDNA